MTEVKTSGLRVVFSRGSENQLVLHGLEAVDELLVSRFSGSERFHRGIHGFAHWVSVLDNADRLIDLDPELVSERHRTLVRLAAILHDTGRLLPGGRDGVDPAHPIESERFARVELPRLRLNLAGEDVDSVALLCRLHCREEKALEDRLASRGLAGALAAVRDADRLDRTRLRDLDPSYFQLPAVSSRLVEHAELKWRAGTQPDVVVDKPAGETAAA